MKDQPKCNHTLKEHMMMEEAKASSELGGARIKKSVCELLDIVEQDVEDKERIE